MIETEEITQSNINNVLKQASSVPIYMQRKVLFRESLYNDTPLAHSPTTSISYDAKKHDKTNLTNGINVVSLFPKEKLLQKLSWETVFRVGPGLVNLGNTCFINAALQCLIYIPPFANYMLSRDHSSHCRVSTTCIFCEIENVVIHCLKRNDKAHFLRNEYFCPKAIVVIAKHMKLGRQEDAHEFTRFLLDAMQKNYLQSFSKTLDAKIKETTVIHQIFGGYFQSRITCSVCSHQSDTYDCFLDICLDIKHAESLDKAFKLFTSMEKLSHGNAYKCSKCNKLVTAEKQTTIKTPPLVLTIQLKRFAFKGFGEDAKVTKPVHYPEYLNLSPYMTDSKTETNYSLTGVLVHTGHACNSGHYYSFIKSPNQIWYSMNDTSVHPVGTSAVLRQSAYVLFYTMIPKKDPSSNALPEDRHDNSIPLKSVVNDNNNEEKSQQSSRSSLVVKQPSKCPSPDLTFSKSKTPLVENKITPSLVQTDLMSDIIKKGKNERVLKNNGITTDSKDATSFREYSDSKLNSTPAMLSHSQSKDNASSIEKESKSHRGWAEGSLNKLTPTVYTSHVSPWEEKSLIEEPVKSQSTTKRSATTIDKPLNSYDQDYDRGKIKKIKKEKASRMQKENPFQKLVENKTKAKKLGNKLFK